MGFIIVVNTFFLWKQELQCRNVNLFSFTPRTSGRTNTSSVLLAVMHILTSRISGPEGYGTYEPQMVIDRKPGFAGRKPACYELSGKSHEKVSLRPEQCSLGRREQKSACGQHRPFSQLQFGLTGKCLSLAKKKKKRKP